MNYFVTGHRNPDTDTVVSAIALAQYLKKSGIEAEAITTDKVNRETEFVLNYFKVSAPRVLKKAPKGASFYLVDHGGIGQSIPGLEEDSILGVVDHHQMVGLKTAEPIFYRCEVVGSTATLIAKLFYEKGWKIDKKIGGLLVSGIISDTLNLKSKTTTKEDALILKRIAKEIGVDTKELAKKLFEAKSDISGIKLIDLILGDFKEYEHKGKRLAVGVLETVDVAPFNSKREEVLKLLDKVKREKKLDLLFFGSVDILKKRTSLFLISDDERRIAQKAFKVSGGEVVLLKDVASRKKEMIPPIFNSL